ncbi:hypothetical protein GUJ93_ZPchr0010g10751 [Zizania palustris]|uniref:Uncharacterized protein n=1 Tax=Zizania palustris TaxID=103762 RepID=A0A8J5W973_ZIZPA|nr:hypothetical protein GUJ93_ZPchr0010g10751 [Zizania palustris]
MLLRSYLTRRAALQLPLPAPAAEPRLGAGGEAAAAAAAALRRCARPAWRWPPPPTHPTLSSSTSRRRAPWRRGPSLRSPRLSRGWRGSEFSDLEILIEEGIDSVVGLFGDGGSRPIFLPC